MGENLERRICLNRSVLDFCERVLNDDAFVIEFGSGYSTRWFARRCRSLVSFETAAKWARIVREELHRAGSRASLYVLPPKRFRGDLLIRMRSMPRADLILIDCDERFRAISARAAWRNLKRGGWLIFDDAQRERHADVVSWLTDSAVMVERLEWADGDLDAARERLAIAFKKWSDT